MGYSPRGHTESDTTEHTLTHTHTQDMKTVMALVFCTSFVQAGEQEDFTEEVTQGSSAFPMHTPRRLLWAWHLLDSLVLRPPHLLLCVYSVTHSCLTLCDPMDCSPPGSSVHGILQARTLEWVAVPFSRASSQPRD